MHIGGGHAPDDLPSSQDGDGVGNGHDLFEFMADKDQAFALCRHEAHGGKKVFRLGRSQHRGRFIKDENVAFPLQQFENFHLLFLAHGQLADPGRRIDLHAVLRGKIRYLAVHLLPVQPPATPLAKKDIFGNGHGVDQFEVLIHHAYSCLDRLVGGAETYLLFPQVNGPAVRLQLPGKDGHEGRFAGPVFPEQGEDLAFLQGQRDIAVGMNLAKTFADAFKADEWRRSGHVQDRSLPARGVTNCDSVSQGKRIQVSWLTSVIKVSTRGRPAGLA
jgi:hypothetical protein